MSNIPSTAIVIGGSLLGLAAAVRLAGEGLQVTVLERKPGNDTFNTGLGIDRHQLSTVLGISAFGVDGVSELPVSGPDRDSTTWLAAYLWLRKVVARQSRIRVLHGMDVREVYEDNQLAWAVAADESFSADVIIGADGWNSTLRRYVAPEAAYATYAGYSIWRGLIEQRELPEQIVCSIPSSMEVLWSNPYRLVAYETPSNDGDTSPGNKAISWTWYDKSADRLLASSIRFSGEPVFGECQTKDFGDAALGELIGKAAALWEDPWKSIIVETITRKAALITPVVEYFPVRLATDRLSLIGEAAHAVSPITGFGLSAGLDDIEVLSRAVRLQRLGGASALHVYEEARLPIAQSIVQSSMHWSKGFTQTPELAGGR